MSASPAAKSSRHRAIRLSRESLYEAVWSKPLTLVAADLGISANGLAKICDRVLVPYPGRGYWSKVQAGRADKAKPLPPAPKAVDDTVIISDARAQSRRARTRLTREARAEQLIDMAGQIIEKEGLHAATMKRIAREMGLSEAQAYNYFRTQKDLLVALARREIHAMNSVQRREVERVSDHLTRITLSTIIYLRQVSQRGALLQTLLNNPEVRLALRQEHHARRKSNVRAVTERLAQHYALPDDFGYGSTAILTAVCLRAGRLLANKKIGLELAERLTLAIVLKANRDLMRNAAQ